MKISKSCTQCRSGKRKCVVEGTEWTCQHCLKQGKPCSLSQLPKRQRHLLPNNTPERDDKCQSVTADTKHQLVDLYLHLIHDKPHTLFHPALLRERECEMGLFQSQSSMVSWPLPRGKLEYTENLTIYRSLANLPSEDSPMRPPYIPRHMTSS